MVQLLSAVIVVLLIALITQHIMYVRLNAEKDKHHFECIETRGKAMFRMGWDWGHTQGYREGRYYRALEPKKDTE